MIFKKKIPVEGNSTKKNVLEDKKYTEVPTQMTADIINAIEKIVEKGGFNLTVSHFSATLSDNVLDEKERSVAIGFLRADADNKFMNTSIISKIISRIDLAKSELMKIGLDVAAKDPKSGKTMVKIIKDLIDLRR